VEIVERVEHSPEIIEACKRLKAGGYTIALDDFSFEESVLPLLELADIVKVEFPAIDFEKQHRFIRKYGKRVKFLAEKVETREEYHLATAMGYDYFQGYFFSMPVIEKRKYIVSMPTVLVRMAQELDKPEPDFQMLTEIMETDVGLSYKFLRFAGSAYFGTSKGIYTVKQALVRVGFNEIGKWMYLLLLKDVQNVENKELVKTCLIRAKFMELLAIEAGGDRKHYAYFLAGLFSSIHVLLDCTMEEAVRELPITPDVKDALLGRTNDIRNAMDLILHYELGRWDEMDTDVFSPGLKSERLMALYILSLQWVINLDF
jgi:EAL and modified HD-GYP domain-containing signal transduction protein